MPQIQQAASAIAAQLTSSGSGKGRGFDGAGGRKLTVDVPVLESGPVAAVALAQEIIAALPKPLAKQFTVVSCGDGALPSGGGGGARVLSLQQCVADGADLTGCLLITGPSAAQARLAAGRAVCRSAWGHHLLLADTLGCPCPPPRPSLTLPQIDAVMRLLAYWRGPGAVVLNADWSAASAPPEQVGVALGRRWGRAGRECVCLLPAVPSLSVGHNKHTGAGAPAQVAFLRTLESVYCFMPLMVKVLFIGQVGGQAHVCSSSSSSVS